MTTEPTPMSSRLRSPDKKVTAPLGRGQLELALKRALDAGPETIGEQIRYILALSQLGGARSDHTPYLEKPIRATQARLAALGSFASALSEEQIRALVQDAERIKDPIVRLQMMVSLALHLPPQSYRTIVQEVWNNTQRLKDRVAKTRLLLGLAPLLSLVNDEPGTATALLDVVGQAQKIRNVEARVRSLTALSPYLPYALSVRVYQRIFSEIDQMMSDHQRCQAVIAVAEKLPDELKSRALSSTQLIDSPSERARALTSLASQMPDELSPRLREDALSAIGSIADEEERSEALIAFIPYLETAGEDDEFPALLERALAIAVGISRRHIRARVLVALAPNLTLDLQGEALAAVHSLNSERDRAMLLAELAPTLPPEMLVASLAVAHTMREQDSRVHALSVLAHYVPENARAQTMLDALAAASNLPHHFERVTALVALVDILPDHLREQALTNALETVRLIDNENARARALNLLGGSLSGNLLLRSLEVARQFKDTQQRMNALLGIVPSLNGSVRQDAVEDLLDCARDTTLEYKRARMLINSIPHLPQEKLGEVQNLAESFDDPHDKVSTYMALLHYLPPDRRPAIIARAWTLIKMIDDGYDRASMLASIAPYLPETAYNDLAKAGSIAIRAIVDEYDKASAISILAPLLNDRSDGRVGVLPDSYKVVQIAIETALSIPTQSLRVQLLEQGVLLWIGINDAERTYALWQEIVRRLKTMPLADVLLCLGVLTPFIEVLAGKESLRDIARILGVR